MAALRFFAQGGHGSAFWRGYLPVTFRPMLLAVPATMIMALSMVSYQFRSDI